MWIQDAWDVRKGRTISIQVRKEIERVKSQFQEIVIYETECFGKLMLIDGVIMLTEFDEFAYHEMIAHVPLHTHPAPGKVLVIGGGDGGTVREVLKHGVREVVLCDIDEEVIKLSQRHLPAISSSLADPRVSIVCRDGTEYIREKPGYYDVIIVDSTDPEGPGEQLFTRRFYENMKEALAPEGIAVTQSESMYYDRKTIRNLFSFNKTLFPVACYYYALVPTYPSGTIGFSLCSRKYHPLENIHPCSISGLRYYSTEIHRASFTLPEFMKEDVGG
ncbi:MAG: polyamine aminopropyltransferase [Spirochaetales bacterium]|nr:polyamine aminopropyltransferase [Spirochaetales bacterium]